MCMSKHDQVLVVGNSRFGRIKIPTCIACDRPLLEKVRQESLVQADDSAQRRNFPLFGGGVGGASQSALEDPNSMASTLSLVSGTSPPKLRVRGRATKVKLPVARPTSSHGDATGVVSTLRGGLKMPRPGSSNNFSANQEEEQGMFPMVSMTRSLEEL